MRKTAGLWDEADLRVNEISVCASTAFPNLKQGPEKCDDFAKLQDYGQAEIERFEEGGVDPLKALEPLLKRKEMTSKRH